jgi:hypothetical protein
MAEIVELGEIEITNQITIQRQTEGSLLKVNMMNLLTYYLLLLLTLIASGVFEISEILELFVRGSLLIDNLFTIS